MYIVDLMLKGSCLLCHFIGRPVNKNLNCKISEKVSEHQTLSVLRAYRAVLHTVVYIVLTFTVRGRIDVGYTLTNRVTDIHPIKCKS